MHYEKIVDIRHAYPLIQATGKSQAMMSLVAFLSTTIALQSVLCSGEEAWLHLVARQAGKQWKNTDNSPWP